MGKLVSYGGVNMLNDDPIAALRARDKRVKKAQSGVTGKEGATTAGAKGAKAMSAAKKKDGY